MPSVRELSALYENVMLGPHGEILHSGASGVSFGERDGKPARAALVELDAACKKAASDIQLRGK